MGDKIKKRKIKKEKLIAQFIVSSLGVPKIIGEKKFKIDRKRTVSFKGRSFPIFFDKPAYKIGEKKYFLFDYLGTGQMILDDILEKNLIVQGEEGEYVLKPTGQLFFSEGSENALMTLELLDDIAEGDAIYQIIKAGEPKKVWTEMIMGVVCGLGIGLFIGSLIPGMMN